MENESKEKLAIIESKITEQKHAEIKDIQTAANQERSKYIETQIGHDECVVYKQLYIYKELCN